MPNHAEDLPVKERVDEDLNINPEDDGEPISEPFEKSGYTERFRDFE